MKSSTQVASLVLVAIASLLVFRVPSTDAAIPCNKVITFLTPCASYLQSGDGMPPSACCEGAKALMASASTTADRQAACSCLKSASEDIDLNLGLAASIPVNCGIDLGFTISPNVDCSM
ncbi:hypothetical protein OSB04_013070 [Centaurea solstitialis]|uniref:Non-specific lipid-transfer protein n=1 Tax=Centaurea solstitialis TaxID=347529 RepID=A0AA38WR21_9ASTR|nr:hypothetical protein OSB04_013070 [Centaurea solstitialis]